MKKEENYIKPYLKEEDLITNHKIVDVYEHFILVQNEKDLYGIIPLNTKNINGFNCQFKYTSIGQFVNDYAVFKKGERLFCLVDWYGNEKWEVRADNCYCFDDNIYKVNGYDNIYNLLMDTTGNILIELTMTYLIDYFQGDYSIVTDQKLSGNHRYGLINRQGKQVLDYKYRHIHLINNEYAIVNYNELIKIKEPDKSILKVKKGSIKYLGRDRIVNIEKRKTEIYDLSGNLIKKFKKREKIINLEQTKADVILTTGLTKRLVDFDGNILTDAYDEMGVYDDGIVIACKYEKISKYYFYLLNQSGDMVLDKAYDHIYKLADSLYTVRKNGYYGCYNNNTKTYIGVKYQDIKYVDNRLIVKRLNKYGLLDLNGNEVLEIAFDEIKYLVNGLFAAKQGRKYYLINRFGKQVSDKTYKNIYVKQDSYMIGLTNRGKVLIDENGNELLKYILPGIKCEIEHNLIHLYNDSFDSLYNLNGQPIFENNKIESFHIVNEECVIIDNHLMNVNDIKPQYMVDIDDKTYSFDSLEQRNEFLKNAQNNQLKLWKQTRSELIKYIKSKNEEQLNYLEQIVSTYDPNNIKTIDKEIVSSINNNSEEIIKHVQKTLK